MPLKEIHGDLVATLLHAKANPDPDHPFLMAQGCNCFVAQGAGLAKDLRRVPEVYAADVAYGRKGERSKLGEFSLAEFPGAKVFNAYTQYHWGGPHPVDYEAIRAVFPRILDACDGHVLHLPLIGAGLAGGNWSMISQIIQDAANGRPVTVVHYERNRIIDYASQ